MKKETETSAGSEVDVVVSEKSFLLKSKEQLQKRMTSHAYVSAGILTVPIAAYAVTSSFAAMFASAVALSVYSIGSTFSQFGARGAFRKAVDRTAPEMKKMLEKEHNIIVSDETAEKIAVGVLVMRKIQDSSEPTTNNVEMKGFVAEDGREYLIGVTHTDFVISEVTKLTPTSISQPIDVTQLALPANLSQEATVSEFNYHEYVKQLLNGTGRRIIVAIKNLASSGIEKHHIMMFADSKLVFYSLARADKSEKKKFLNENTEAFKEKVLFGLDSPYHNVTVRVEEQKAPGTWVEKEVLSFEEGVYLGHERWDGKSWQTVRSYEKKQDSLNSNHMTSEVYSIEDNDAHEMVNSLMNKFEILNRQTLSSEDDYIVKRAFADVQEALMFSSQLKELHDDSYIEPLKYTLNLIIDELERIIVKQLDSVKDRIKEQQQYIAARKPNTPQLILKKSSTETS